MDIAVLPDERVLLDRPPRSPAALRPDRREREPRRRARRLRGRGGRPADGHARPGLRDRTAGSTCTTRGRSPAACSQADQLGGVLKCGVNRLARFKWDEATDRLDLASEQKIIEVPTQRDLCCHVGGDVGFDSQGNLYLSTGDNTNSWASDGYSPIDERPNRAPFDAQRSSGNTNDLRGKLLRINVAADGSYTIPDGNLFGPNGRFPAVDGKTRPEIYSMGHRNPFRFTIDPVTDWVYMGEVGPDAGGDNPNRGPRQYEELNIIKRAGNGGWPHCIGTPQNIGGTVRLPRLRLRHGRVRARVRLRQRPDQRLADQHRADAAAARRQPADDLVPVRQLLAVPGAGQRRRHRDGRPRLSLRRRPAVGHQVAGLLGRDRGLLRVVALVPEGRQVHRERRAAADQPDVPGHRLLAADGHGVRAGRLALRDRVRRRLLHGRPERRPVPDRLRQGPAPPGHRARERRGLGPGAADGQLRRLELERSGRRRPDVRVGLRRRRRPTTPPARPRPTTTRQTASTPPRSP